MLAKRRASQDVYGIIREMAIDYEFRPDEDINETALAVRLGVSRTPVRDTLHRLLNEGLMSFQPKRGFFCRSLNAEEFFDLAEARAGLERQALELALLRAPLAARKRLLEFWVDVDSRIETLTTRQVARHDEEFHEQIFQMSENAVLLELIRHINARIRFVRQIEIEKQFRAGAHFREHFKIAKSLIKDDREGAMVAMLRHVTFTPDDAVTVLKEGLARIYMSDGVKGSWTRAEWEDASHGRKVSD